jgi:hypothetical protein
VRVPLIESGTTCVLQSAAAHGFESSRGTD